MKDTFYVTTPIYYPSGKFHIGTAYSTVVADALKRYNKLKGKESYMLTGTDEHGQKIEIKAQESGETPQQYVDKMAAMAKELWAKMDIQYDDYIQTTEERHTKIVQKIFDKFMEQGDIYKGEYEGKYCIPCETFFTETQLVDGKCPDCGRDVKLMKEHVGNEVKVKAAGGIRDAKTFMKMVECGAERIGTSAGVTIIKDFEAMMKEQGVSTLEI